MTLPLSEHRSRHGRLGRSVVWRLHATTLSMTDEDGGGRIFALRDIREVRLYLMPSRLWEHYVCELRLSDNTMLRIGDEYARFLVWRVFTTETYRDFIMALCAALAAQEPRCRFRAGPLLWTYLLSVLAMAAAIHLLAQAMVVHMGMSETDRYWLLAFGYGLILLKSPYWRGANRLTEFDPTDIPEGFLPREAGTTGARS